jgi:hypothetical protein
MDVSFGISEYGYAHHCFIIDFASCLLLHLHDTRNMQRMKKYEQLNVAEMRCDFFIKTVFSDDYDVSIYLLI